jgi:predicted nucleic acid-binding protein
VKTATLGVEAAMYLDSAILVKLVVREPDSLFYAGLVDGQSGVWSSALALTECWSALCRKVRDGDIDLPTRGEAWERFEAAVGAQRLQLQPVTQPVLRLANRFIGQCDGRVALRTLDAIHLASCECCGAGLLLTSDRVMRQAAAVLGLALGPVAS